MLGFEVTLVDPEPTVPILDRYKCVRRHRLPAVYANQADHPWNAFVMFESRERIRSRKVFRRHFYFRRHGLHQAED